MKRIAFLISDQHLIPHGGIGQFCKSFTEMATDLGYTVDIKDRYDRGSLDYVKTLDEQAPKLWKEFIEGVNK